MTWVPWLFSHDIPQVPYREHLKEGCLEGAKCCNTVTTRSVFCAKITSELHACNTFLKSLGTNLSRSLVGILGGAGNLLGYPPADLWVFHCCPLKLSARIGDHSGVTEEGSARCTVGNAVPCLLLLGTQPSQVLTSLLSP